MERNDLPTAEAMRCEESWKEKKKIPDLQEEQRKYQSCMGRGIKSYSYRTENVENVVSQWNENTLPGVAASWSLEIVGQSCSR